MDAGEYLKAEVAQQPYMVPQYKKVKTLTYIISVWQTWGKLRKYLFTGISWLCLCFSLLFMRLDYQVSPTDYDLCVFFIIITEPWELCSPHAHVFVNSGFLLIWHSVLWQLRFLRFSKAIARHLKLIMYSKHSSILEDHQSTVLWRSLYLKSSNRFMDILFIPWVQILAEKRQSFSLL